MSPEPQNHIWNSDQHTYDCLTKHRAIKGLKEIYMLKLQQQQESYSHNKKTTLDQYPWVHKSVPLPLQTSQKQPGLSPQQNRPWSAKTQFENIKHKRLNEIKK